MRRSALRALALVVITLFLLRMLSK